jgi:hypothetical protein
LAVADTRYTLRVSALLIRCQSLLAALGEHVDASEVADVLAGTSEVDTEHVPVVAAVPTSAIEQLRSTSGVVVSRDFRAAGRGQKFDRVREYDPKVHGYPRNKQRGQARGVLKWESIATIVIHTAGVSGMHPDRWLGVPTHVAVANDASVVLCHELNAYLWAAHAANRYSCSLEIAGNKTISEAQVVSGRAALRYMVNELRSRRPGPVHVAPHRFSHKSRAQDCGAEIWAALGEWAMQMLGCELGPVVGSGQGLPF